MKKFFLLASIVTMFSLGIQAEETLDPMFDSIMSEAEQQLDNDAYLDNLAKMYGAETNEQYQSMHKQLREYEERRDAAEAQRKAKRWLAFVLSLSMALLPSFVILKRVITGELQPANAVAVWRTVGTLLFYGIVIFGLNYAWLWCMFTGKTQIMGIVLGMLLFAFVIYAIYTLHKSKNKNDHTNLRSVVLLLALSLFACAPKERPVPPSDGSEPVYLSNPQMVVDGKHINIFYMRNADPVKAEILKDASLSAPVYVDEKKWLDFLESELVSLPDVDEDTKAVVDQMPFASELVPTPDNVRLFFTAYSRETGKRELYWIRNGGILPVRLSQDNWWADFEPPFAFLEVEDECFQDGTKAYVALCLGNDHWNPGEICAVYMNGSTQYTILSHENTALRDSMSNSLAVGKTKMKTSDGSVIHYAAYRKWGTVKREAPVHIMYVDTGSSCVAWNEKVIRNALDGEYVIVASEADFFSKQDYADFENYIHADFAEQ